jgi:CheY-like chemotaxis protein
MARMVDDLLDVSRITRGTISLRREPIDLRTAVERASQTCRPILESRRHRLTVSLPPDPLPLLADPDRIEQVLVNLLHNAAKYTEPGGRVDIEVDAAGGAAVVFVRDTGRGIAPELLPRIFDLFNTPQELARSEGGLGIGLTLVRSLVELHGGTVVARNRAGGPGSEFEIRLPLTEAGTAAAEPISVAAPVPVRRPSRGKRVLLVEDSADNRDLLAELLRLWGHGVEVAVDGRSGLEMALAGEFDVGIIDIGLPLLNGFDLAAGVREAEANAPAGRRPRTFLIAMTGYGQPEDRHRTRASGFDLHLVKPVNLRELERRLQTVPER